MTFDPAIENEIFYQNEARRAAHAARAHCDAARRFEAVGALDHAYARRMLALDCQESAACHHNDAVWCRNERLRGAL